MNADRYRELLRRLGVEADLSPADAYRLLLRQGFELTRQGAAASQDACATFLDQQARLTDEIGPARARLILRATARAWWAETGICPWCGDVGAYHETERSA